MTQASPVTSDPFDRLSLLQLTLTGGSSMAALRSCVRLVPAARPVAARPLSDSARPHEERARTQHMTSYYNQAAIDLAAAKVCRLWSLTGGLWPVACLLTSDLWPVVFDWCI